MRIVIEEPCEHGMLESHETSECWAHEDRHKVTPECWCPGGSRRILPSGSLVISKENGEWPEWAVNLVEFIDDFGGDVNAGLLDALAEGVPVGRVDGD